MSFDIRRSIDKNSLNAHILHMRKRERGSLSSRFFRSVALCVCLGLHFSVCTGGLLSVTAALAADFSGYDKNMSSSMSRADADSLLCRFMSFDIRESRADDVTDVAEEERGSSACGGEKSCISASAASLKQRDMAAHSHADEVFIAPFAEVPRPLYASAHRRSVRSNQDLSRSRMIASILVKRE